MIPEINELYQEMILDHNRRPRHFGKLDNPTAYSHGHNPLCGDDYHLYLKVDEKGKIEGVQFEGSGCAISKSSASMMTTMVLGKSAAEAESLACSFVEFVTQEKIPDSQKESLGRLKIFEGVKKFPVRVKCATLIWQALNDALKDLKKT